MKSRRFLLPVIISALHFCTENQLAVIKGFLDLINAVFRVRQLRSHPVKRHDMTKKEQKCRFRDM